MNLKKFLQSLAPNFDRSRILQDIDALADEQASALIPLMDNTVAAMRGHPIKSNYGKVAAAMAARRFPEARGISHMTLIQAALKNSHAALDVFGTLVPEVFSRDVTKDALTYKKASILQYLTIVRFFNDYTAAHMLALIGAEAAAVEDQEAAWAANQLPVVTKFLTNNLEAYFQAIKILTVPAAEVAGRLESMEDMQIILDKIAVVASTAGQSTVDPLNLGFTGIATGLAQMAFPVIYAMRSSSAAYMVADNARNKETAKSIQLRLLALKDAYQRKADPRLQQQIEYSEARLARLNQDVSEFEAKYGS